ncbi:MAG: hypothetical protein D6800_09050 [Candidatus Zixiibacteriota bacterium]|nr:MAG: hypothetical protein D6800_09050 [candidate division Zixibacteria bacterium]
MIIPEQTTEQREAVSRRLAEQGYPPAQAAEAVSAGKHAEAISLCRSWLENHPDAVTARLVYATALFRTDQKESAAEELRRVLADDPENIKALKLLSDIEFSAGNEFVAMNGYQRILEIDPDCGGLSTPLTSRPREQTHTITLRRTAEDTSPAPKTPTNRIFFYTETMGDLYLKQGHPRLAAEVFRTLVSTNPHPRLQEKLARAEGRATERKT